MKLYKQVLIDSIVGDDQKVETVMNVAAAVIYKVDENDTRQVLLIQRATDDHWPNHWEFPRGKCDKGKNESVISCCKREVKEETGLDIKVVALIDKFEYLADGGKRKSICHNFLCELKNPDQKIKLSKEHQDFHWITEIGEVELMVLPDQKKALEKVLNKDRAISSTPENDFTKNNQIEEHLKNIIKGYLKHIQ